MSTGIMHSSTVRRIVGPTILLASGNYFDFMAPEAGTFTIEDIAHGLSHICRFAGHCQRFYSVAQHSVIASKHVPGPDAYAALMHDAAEAFVGDMAKPLKDLCPEYREIEKRVEAAVFQRFAVPLPLPPSVKEIDTVMLATEQRELMRNRDDWNYTRGRQPLDISIPPMTPAEAKSAFLARFAELAPTEMARPLYEAAPRPAGDLAGLSQRATPGTLSVSGARRRYHEPSCVIVDASSCSALFALATGEHGEHTLQSLADAKFLVGLWNAYRSGALTPAAPRPAVTEEEIAKVIYSSAPEMTFAGDGPRILKWGEAHEVNRKRAFAAAARILSLFRDADRGGEEGAR